MTDSRPASAFAGTSAASLTAALDFLSQLTQVVASNTELQPILDWMVEKTTTLLSADEGSIRLVDPAMTSAPQTMVRKPRAGLESGSWEPAVSMSVMGFLMIKQETLNTPDLLADSRFPGLKNIPTRVRSVLAAPLRVENRINGMLAVTNRNPGREWSPEEVQLLSIVASYSGEAIEKARLRADAEAKKRMEEEQKRFEREISQARDIQMSLVPSQPLTMGNWEVHGRVIPARQVGGDYFDFFELDDTRFGITIADVSGKGLPASLLMTNVQASLRAFCDGGLEIPDALRRINRNLARTIAPGKFITLFYAEIDTGRGVLRYSNAGHNYPMLRRADGTIEELGIGGVMLGPMENATYELGQVPFADGDALLLYSDGISEQFDHRDNQFGEERLAELWKACSGLPTAEMVERVIGAVIKFRGASAQSDDMTVVVVGPRRAP
jgi:serine phosphatase RsbU (regulator of sigma subunit)